MANLKKRARYKPEKKVNGRIVDIGGYLVALDKIISTIKHEKAKRVLLQLPDGLKPHATLLAEKIEKLAGCECLIWFGSCFGACDLPQLGTLEREIDLVVQVGHAKWPYRNQKISVINF